MTTRLMVEGAVPRWTVADRLRKAREHAGLTQGQLAEAIDVSQRSISAYEGGTSIRRPVLLAWAMCCGVSYDWLQHGNPPPRTDPQTGKAS